VTAKKPQEVLGCIYLLTNLTNGKRYVGQYGNVLFVIRRYNRHITTAFTDDDPRPLYRSMRKAWRESKGQTIGFSAEILWTGPVEKLHEKEIHYIKKLRSFNCDPLGDKSYNLTKGGDGVRGLVWSKAARKKLRAARKKQFEDGTVGAKMSASHLLRYKDQAERNRQGSNTRNRFKNNPAAHAQMTAAQLRRYKDPIEHEKTGIASKLAWSKRPIKERRAMALRGWETRRANAKKSKKK
jgi:hypothetical protein